MPLRRGIGRNPWWVHMAEVESEELRATPRGIGSIGETSTKMEGSDVRHTLAPESAIEVVWRVVGHEAPLVMPIPTMVTGRVA